MQKVEEKYQNCGDKEKSVEYYRANKDALKEKSKRRYRNWSEEGKKAKKSIQKTDTKNK